MVCKGTCTQHGRFTWTGEFKLTWYSWKFSTKADNFCDFRIRYYLRFSYSLSYTPKPFWKGVYSRSILIQKGSKIVLSELPLLKVYPFPLIVNKEQKNFRVKTNAKFTTLHRKWGNRRVMSEKSWVSSWDGCSCHALARVILQPKMSGTRCSPQIAPGFRQKKTSNKGL